MVIVERILASGISRFMESGKPEIPLRYLLTFTNNEIGKLSEILDKWYKLGCISWIKPFDISQLDTPVVRFGRFPDSNVIWPPPLKCEYKERRFIADIEGDGRFTDIYPIRQRELLIKYCPNLKLTEINE